MLSTSGLDNSRKGKHLATKNNGMVVDLIQKMIYKQTEIDMRVIQLEEK